MRHSHLREDGQTAQEGGIIVYKLVAVVDDRLTSLCMGGKCSVTYSQEQVTVPPLPGSPLFAYRTLEVANREYLRIRDINAWSPLTSSIPLQLWMARTSGEIPGPDRIPLAGVYYNSLVRHAAWGAGLAGCYAFFWQNVSYCLKHCIGKRAGQKLDPAITICCKDLVLLEQQFIQEGEGTCL